MGCPGFVTACQMTCPFITSNQCMVVQKQNNTELMINDYNL